jgi:hypothetical protein
MVEFTLEGLNARQQVLADIMWSLEEYADVQTFIKTLPRKERAEAEGIIEMMRMAVVEQCYDGIQNLDAARKAIDKARK